MVERPLSIWCYSSEVELSAAVRMVGGSIPPDTFSCFCTGGLAQMVERSIRIRQVGGSIPPVSTKKEEFSAGRGIDAPILHSKTGN